MNLSAQGEDRGKVALFNREPVADSFRKHLISYLIRYMCGYLVTFRSHD